VNQQDLGKFEQVYGIGAGGKEREGQCLTDLLVEQACSRPNAVAVVSDVDTMTFRALADRSAGIGRYLRHLGVAPDDCVGLFVEPSLEMVLGVWGTLFSGAAYLPLSPEYPEDRVRFMIEQSQTKVIFCGETLRAKLSALAPEGTRFVTERDAAGFVGSHTTAPDFRLQGGPHSRNLAYVIYTSGSTGNPKGVMIEHRSIVNQMNWLREVYGIDRRTVILQKTPMSFDAAQWEILAVTCGSKVVMGAPGVYRDPVGLIGTVVRHGVTALQCVPTLLQALVDTDTFHRCLTLTQVFSGGEALTRRLAAEILSALPKCQVVNLYGPTECTINSSAFTVNPAKIAAGPATIPIGAPVYNTQYYVLDGSCQPLGVGETGELYIGGDQLARGYLHRPDLTAERFIDDPFHSGPGLRKLYRTGDLVSWNADGTVQFAGRADNQIKLRGYRIELDEVRHGIEQHPWVKGAAVVVKKDQRTGCKNLIAFVELNAREAALMDQGNHEAHHQSKRSKTQVRAQLANPGCRDSEELAGREVVELPGKTPTAAQARRVFARKTYRFYDGGAVRRADLLQLLTESPADTKSLPLDRLTLADFGEILRYFGQFQSEERLLPKYGYASPGALYATQMYLEIDGFEDLGSGYYYYHPVHHHLVLIQKKAGVQAGPRVLIHFVGKKRAIEPIYKNNIREVLEIEAGHMVGLFQVVLPHYGLGIRDIAGGPAAKAHLDCAAEDYDLGSFEIVPHADRMTGEAFDIYVQSHPGKIDDLPPGLYRFTGDELEWVSDEVVLKKQVIAINQQVYEQASFGITLVSRTVTEWLSYVELGRKLHLFQMSDAGLGFMSSGYSSKSGQDLPSAKRMEAILRGLGRDTGPSYFVVGGRVSDGQRASQGMKEDAVHMKGPAEMIKDDLTQCLPAYMIPNRVVVLDALPQTANGKIDLKELATAKVESADRRFVAPRTATEERLCELWKAELKVEEVSVQDDFFEAGGDSLLAVGLVHRIIEAFGCPLPVQAVFQAPTVEKLAVALTGAGGDPQSRLVPLQPDGSKPPVFCWPGLGGYPMNLRLLATRMGTDRPFLGVQAYGINPGETPYGSIQEMAAVDVHAIKQRQPSGPYTLWGYSFGARVAFEAAYQLERDNEVVENVFLIAPGSPRVRGKAGPVGASYANPEYLTILFSVFTGTVAGAALDECLRTVTDERGFVSFICDRKKNLDPAQVRRIAHVVASTYGFRYSPEDLAKRRILAPVTVFRAAGDNDSFIDGNTTVSLRVVALDSDHYGLLRDAGVDELVATIRSRTRAASRSRSRHVPLSQQAASS